MEFTKLEMSAIVKLAKVMVMADGRVDEKEMKLMILPATILSMRYSTP